MCYYKGMNERTKNSEAYQVGDLVKTLINDIYGPYPHHKGIPVGEAGLIVEVCDFGEKHNPIYSVRFADNNVVPYYQSDLEVLNNV